MGSGYGSELCVYSPFNREKNCYSYANQPGYKISVDQNGNNMLTNKKDGERFTITEIEVWEVSEISKSDGPSILDSLKKKYESFQNK